MGHKNRKTGVYIEESVDGVAISHFYQLFGNASMTVVY